MPGTDLAALRKHMADNPGGVIEDVVRENSVSAREVIEALPDDMRRFAPGSAFVPAMQDIATWGEVTLIVHTDDGIFEVTEPVGGGEVGRGYYNIMKPKGLHGHLRHERCGSIAFVERPFMGKSSAFVAFLNVDGGVMFKVFVGRDETRALKADQLEKFRALAMALG
ncbi:MAG: heme utilization cystosolic carrier protein HutX [Afipia sp.]|nr:heme utilization cystosolic carrier protein HutX [Afipia sp.]